MGSFTFVLLILTLCDTIWSISPLKFDHDDYHLAANCEKMVIRMFNEGHFDEHLDNKPHLNRLDHRDRLMVDSYDSCRKNMNVDQSHRFANAKMEAHKYVHILKFDHENINSENDLKIP
jgi:hypothetical protein